MVMIIYSDGCYVYSSSFVKHLYVLLITILDGILKKLTIYL